MPSGLREDARGKDNWAWKAYWQEPNRLAACVPENAASAAGIEAHWRTFFASLPQGARVLDIATGNGVLLVWAAQAAASVGRALELTGVDLADIDPERFLPEYRADLSSARFEGNVAAESLPFPDASFDIVVSQYGLEYASLEPALAEAARVLVPGGRLHWLAHAEDSAVVGEGQRQLVQLALLLKKDGPFAAMEDYLLARERGRKVQRATRDLTAALKEAEAHCKAHPPARLLNELCSGILEVANNWQRYRPEDARQWLKENRKRLRAFEQRTRDLQAACLDESRRRQLGSLLAQSPWEAAEVQALSVGDAGSCVGLCIDAETSGVRSGS
jgi:ubiquinone/menaquinone biosynthesis C-methylase UbiE